MTINANDKVTIKGSKVKMKDKSVLLAAEITKDSKVVKLRDGSGRPLWARQGKGRGMGRGGMTN